MFLLDGWRVLDHLALDGGYLVDWSRGHGQDWLMVDNGGLLDRLAVSGGPSSQLISPARKFCDRTTAVMLTANNQERNNKQYGESHHDGLYHCRAMELHG